MSTWTGTRSLSDEQRKAMSQQGRANVRKRWGGKQLLYERITRRLAQRWWTYKDLSDDLGESIPAIAKSVSRYVRPKLLRTRYMLDYRTLGNGNLREFRIVERPSGKVAIIEEGGAK